MGEICRGEEIISTLRKFADGNEIRTKLMKDIIIEIDAKDKYIYL